MSVKHARQTQRFQNWLNEFKDLIEGISGGFLFGVPLLYTMEVWFIGSRVQPKILLLILGVTYVVILLLNRVVGFRENSKHRTIDAAAESVEAMAIGLVCAAVMLVLLQEISWQSSLGEALGKIIFESVPFSFGVALSRLILRGDRELPNQAKSQRQSRKKATNLMCADTVADLSATSIGAAIVAFAIAPTDEVPMLAVAASPPWLLAIIAVSLLISYAIVFVACFTDREKRRQQQGFFQRPSGETIFSYLVSLLVSALMLWFFQQLSWQDPWDLWLDYTIILGLPATIGGAAGRIAL
ncbi:MAG: TIGR02587 family membrane protein [Xenococcaceae cyanobacterium]